MATPGPRVLYSLRRCGERIRSGVGIFDVTRNMGPAHDQAAFERYFQANRDISQTAPEVILLMQDIFSL